MVLFLVTKVGWFKIVTEGVMFVKGEPMFGGDEW